ncbi:MAG: efflux RND transporter periplasmic adaptor subunit [Chloroflexota bacterium]
MKFKTLWVSLTLLALAGCSALPGSTPTALPTVVLGSGNATTPSAPTSSGVSSGLVASGVIAPAQQAQLAASLAGTVAAVDVAVGDTVQAGQTLVQLEGQESLQAAISAAQFELELTQQALKDLDTQAETARVQAMQAIVTYAQAVKNAQYILDNFTIPPGQASLDAVTALNLMKQRLDEARRAFEAVKSRPSGDPTRQDLKEALDEAQSDYNTAVRRLQYEYDLQVAESQLAQAQHDYEIYSAGPDPDQVRLANARVSNAQTQLSAAQAALGHLTILAPFDGVVTLLNTHRGEWVTPGQIVLALADLAHLRVETTDLSERDIPGVSIGQPVTVFIEALNQTLPGRVSLIAPLADTLGGDVVYKTTIDLDISLPNLRAGMSVEVQFLEAQ